MIISHRGNINGPSDKENNPVFLGESMDKYKTLFFEIDIWRLNNTFYFGHEQPKYKVSDDFVRTARKRAIFHTKNAECLFYLKDFEDLHYFYHENDYYTLTSKGFIWSHVNNELSNNRNCIICNFDNKRINNCSHICTDYPLLYLYK